MKTSRRDFFRRGFRPETEPMDQTLTLSRREFSFLMLFTLLFASVFKEVLDLFKKKPEPIFNPEIIVRTMYGRLVWTSNAEHFSKFESQRVLFGSAWAKVNVT